MSYLTLHHFGLPDNTFKKHLKTTDLDNVSIVVKGAIANHDICSIIGPTCVGKSHAVATALPPNTQIVEPTPADKERMRIGAIEDEIVCCLSNESPKRSASARSRQIRPILGDATKKGPVVLIIEEAHRLHHSTLLSLKTIHELKWAGRADLLTIILIGERDPLAVPTLKPLALRTESILMAGLSVDEAFTYIKGTVGRVWTDEAVSALAATKEARNYLDLREAVIAAMDQALAEGRKTVELSDIFHATGAGLKEMAQKLNVSLSDIGKATGMDKTSVHRVMSGEREDPDKKAKINNFLQSKLSNNQPVDVPLKQTAHA